MEQKIYCFQCHNSTYCVATTKTRNLIAPGEICLYCYAKHKYLPKDTLINGCRNVLPESRQKLLDGTWNPNVTPQYR